MSGGAQDLFERLSSPEAGPAWLTGLRGLARAASGFYGLGVGARNLAHDLGLAPARYLPVPVVGVGNLTVGGTGKTPLVMEVVAALARLGLPSAVVSRGYGGQAARSGRSVTWVSLGQGPLVTASQAGDEPVLLARRLQVPVAVGPNRHAVGREVVHRTGLRVLVGDDMFQHRGLHRDLDLVALDASRPLGNGRLLPAGPLREPARGLRRAQAIVLTRADDPEATRATRAWLRSFWGPGPVLACRHRLRGLCAPGGRQMAPPELKGRRVLAFCGLARPQDFAQALRGLGLVMVDFRSFGDHHAYTPAEIAGLWSQAKALRAQALVTSEKDEARLPAVLPLDLDLWVTRLELEFDEGPQALDQVLAWGLAPWGRKL
ncbi:MAG: tetraacyldisaccharide 4'-kinase [Desulfarculus sp.]|nr:tetraacyldisaccharide 4'-kinase [Desulfarculus sp.]